ncbi:hypothetical protein PENSPDRAFT_752672 [Peniophora sp. CONT]|nr:hypothetical protein PENSPDRAFT_752672 [Peniophora sp. CONT]
MSDSDALIVPLYQGDQLVHTDLPPLYFEEWSAADETSPMNPEWATLVARSCALAGSNARPTTIKMRKPFDPKSLVMEMHLADGHSVFVRVMAPTVNGPRPLPWIVGRFAAEAAVLRWFEHVAPAIPVPRVLATVVEDGIAITTFMPGIDMFHVYPLLSTDARERSLVSWARLSVHMFRLQAPQRFGSPSSFDASGLQLGMHVGIPSDSCIAVDDTTDLLTFFTHLVDARRSRLPIPNDPEMHAALSRRLDRLLEAIRPVIEELTREPWMRRFVLTHCDLRPDNVLLAPTSGELVGIVDWEFCACLPAVLAAKYPEWIYPPILVAPEYSNPRDIFVAYEFDSRDEQKRLCGLYESVVKGLDEEYWKCLVQGVRLREAYMWLETTRRDLDGVGMERWVEDHFGTTALGRAHA